MNILHVIPSIDPETGGPAHAIRRIVACQRDSGHQVGVLTTTRRMRPHPPSTADQLRAFRAEPSFAGTELFFRRSQSPINPGFRFGPLSQLGRLLRRRRERPWPDIVHIHGGFFHLTAAAARWARHHDIAYVNRPAGILNARCLALGRARLKRLFLQASYLPDLRGAAMIHATSAAEKNEVLALLPEVADRVRVIPLGADVDCCDREKAKQRFLRKFPELSGRRIVLYLSRITFKKRPEMLIEACAGLRGRFPDLAVLLVGGADAHERIVRQSVLRHGMTDCVTFAGHLDNQEKCGAFAAASVFALPSIDENFGIAVVEAMAHGLPIVTTPGVATHEYVDRCRAGLTVSGDARSLAAGIDAMLVGHAADWGKRGRQFIQSHLSWQATVAQLCNEYERAVA